MRARQIILTIAALAILASPAAVLAQSGPGPGPGDGNPPGSGWGGGHGPHGGQGGYGNQGAGMLRIIQRILRHLDLEPGQQEAIEGILESAREEIQPWMEQSRSLREAFHETHGIGDFDEGIYRNHFQALAAIDVEIKLIAAEAVSQVWEQLNEEQKQQLEDMRGSFGGKSYRRGSGRRSTS